MIDWSVTNLPLPSALSVTNRSAALRRKAESGRYLQRRRFTTAYEEGTVSFKFLKEQFQIFKGIWVHYLENGTEPFTIDLPVGGNTTLTNCEVKFVNDYTYQYVSVDYVTVQCKIEFKEVTAPDKLALDNLINVGDIYLQREVETIEVGWIRVSDNTTNSGYAANNVFGPNAMATQFWDGTTSLVGARKYLPATLTPEIWTTQFYPCKSTSNPDPDVGRVLTDAAFFAKYSLYSWNPYATSYPWTKIDLVATAQLEMPFPNDTWKFTMRANHEMFRMSGVNKMRNLQIEIQDDVLATATPDSQYAFDVINCSSLEQVEFTSPPNGGKARLAKFNLASLSSLTMTELDLTDFYFVSDGPDTSAYPRVTVKSLNSLTSLTINGLPDSNIYGKAKYDFSYNNLDTLNIVGSYPVYFNFDDFDITNNNFTISGIRNFIDKVKAHPLSTDTHFLIGNNPCWQSNKLYPLGFANPVNITSITSTATDFEVVTSTAHGLSANQWIKLENTGVSYYSGVGKGLWKVASIVDQFTFTVDDTGNGGSATTGTVNTEADADSFYVEVTAHENGFYFAAS